MPAKNEEQISYNMSQIRSINTDLEKIICSELNKRGIESFSRNDVMVYGKPDIVFKAKKVAVFCDSEFWHGYNWEKAKGEFKSNKDFWISKIERNILRDREVNELLTSEGWKILRFWGSEIKQNASKCVDEIENLLFSLPRAPYRTIDLCAGIGGIRRAFELTGGFKNVLSAEIDPYACRTYEHLYGKNPHNDITTEEFKTIVKCTPYDILLAGFPCQTFSRAGLGEGFKDEDKGKIFFHIAEIIRQTRPSSFLLENVDHIVTRDNGATFKVILNVLQAELDYHIIGASRNNHGDLIYSNKDFIRNSKYFGVPQNRPRAYIIGFDRKRFSDCSLANLPKKTPEIGTRELYENLNEVLETGVDPRYYLASGYLDTLIRHRKREEDKGNGYGYRVVNDNLAGKSIANTLLATGGSGKERNLIYEPKPELYGINIRGKKTPLNNKGIRVMTPIEWGKLQGFINYAFLDPTGQDTFSFPKGISLTQQYKQFGNSVTILVVEEMARFVLACLKILDDQNGLITSEVLCNDE